MALTSTQTSGQRPEASPGSVAGTVVEFDGTPLPGVTVRLHGPEPSQEVRSTVTDARARFRFARLTPGVYQLAVTLPGVEATADRVVTVPPGVHVTTTLELGLFATTAEVVVRAEEPQETELSDQQSTSGRQAVETETLDELPLPAEQALEVLPLLPGVVRDPDGQISVDGTFPADSVLLFNGIDLVDPFSGRLRLRLPLEAVERVELYDGVYPASFGNVVGGVVDVRSAAGGEAWKFDVSSFIPRFRFRDGTIMGLRSASPRLRVSGPIGDGLYLSQAFEFHFDRVDVEDVPGDPPEDNVEVQGWQAVTQLDWHPSAEHHSRVVLLAFPQMDDRVGLDGLTPPEATLDFERDAEAFLVSHAWRIDDVSSLDVSTQYNRIGIRSQPQGPAPLELVPEGFRGNAFHSEDRQTASFQLKGAYTRLFREPGDPTSQLVEVGAELHRMDFDGGFLDDTILVRGADGRTLRRIDFVGNAPIDTEKLEWAAYVQDRWWHSERFWCDIGLRVSDDSLTDGVRLSPRVGVAWDPLGDRRTLLKSALGVMYRRVFLGETAWDQLPTRVETVFPDPSLEGSALAAGGTPADAPAATPAEGLVSAFVPTLDDELSAPRTVLFTLEGSRDIGEGLLFRARYFRRETRDQIVFDRRPGEAPALLEMAADGGPPVAGLGDLPTAAIGNLRLSNAGSSTSWGLELAARARLPRDSVMHLSYVWSSAEGDLNDFGRVAGETPIAVLQSNRRGRLPFDVPHRFLAWGVLNLPWLELQASPVVEWRSGFPFSVLAEDHTYLGQPNSERFPDFLAVDLQLTRTFEIAGYSVTGGIKVTNLTDHFNPRQVIANVASDRFGELRNSIDRKIRAKLSFAF